MANRIREEKTQNETQFFERTEKINKSYHAWPGNKGNKSLKSETNRGMADFSGVTMNKQPLGNGTLLERHERKEVNLKTEYLNIRKLERWERARQHEDCAWCPGPTLFWKLNMLVHYCDPSPGDTEKSGSRVWLADYPSLLCRPWGVTPPAVP